MSLNVSVSIFSDKQQEEQQARKDGKHSIYFVEIELNVKTNIYCKFDVIFVVVKTNITS